MLRARPALGANHKQWFSDFQMQYKFVTYEVRPLMGSTPLTRLCTSGTLDPTKTRPTSSCLVQGPKLFQYFHVAPETQKPSRIFCFGGFTKN